MSMPLRVSIPHQLGRVEARRRIKSGFLDLAKQLPGGVSVLNQCWDGDRLAFGIRVLGQTVSGSVEVFDHTVTINVDLPGALGQIAGAFKGRLLSVGQRLLTKQ